MIGLTELKNAETTFIFLYQLQKTLGARMRAGFRKPALKIRTDTGPVLLRQGEPGTPQYAQQMNLRQTDHSCQILGPPHSRFIIKNDGFSAELLKIGSDSRGNFFYLKRKFMILRSCYFRHKRVKREMGNKIFIPACLIQ